MKGNRGITYAGGKRDEREKIAPDWRGSNYALEKSSAIKGKLKKVKLSLHLKKIELSMIHIKINLIRTIKVICLISILLINFSCTAQSHLQKGLINHFGYDQQFQDNNFFGIIFIDNYDEGRYNSHEINIIYPEDSIFKIHSIIKTSNSLGEIDTVFLINSGQWVILENFYRDIINSNSPNNSLNNTSSYTKYKIMIGRNTFEYNDHKSYSLLKDLISK